MRLAFILVGLLGVTSARVLVKLEPFTSSIKIVETDASIATSTSDAVKSTPVTITKPLLSAHPVSGHGDNLIISDVNGTAGLNPHLGHLITRSPIRGPGFKSGIGYSHYTAGGQCRSAAAVKADIARLISKGHDVVRIYGTDCNGPAKVWKAVQGTNMAMFLGIYNIAQADVEARSIAAQLGNNWSNVNTISVGNEVVNNGGNPAAVIAAMKLARNTLRSLGYNGPVVTTDTMVAVLAHPELCTSADYCAMNCHAFFDGGWTASDAGSFVKMFLSKVKAKIGNKPIVISESGWPHGGNSHGKAIAGPIHQGYAIKSLRKAMPTNLILYSGFNEYWLTDNAATYASEHHWGIYGDSPGAR